VPGRDFGLAGELELAQPAPLAPVTQQLSDRAAGLGDGTHGFAPAGPVDAHHQQARFSWTLGPAGAEAPVAGFDVVVTDEDGRIKTVLGFLDRVPS
jgi:hypothetical protein